MRCYPLVGAAHGQASETELSGSLREVLPLRPRGLLVGPPSPPPIGCHFAYAEESSPFYHGLLGPSLIRWGPHSVLQHETENKLRSVYGVTVLTFGGWSRVWALGAVLWGRGAPCRDLTSYLLASLTAPLLQAPSVGRLPAVALCHGTVGTLTAAGRRRRAAQSPRLLGF